MCEGRGFICTGLTSPCRGLLASWWGPNLTHSPWAQASVLPLQESSLRWVGSVDLGEGLPTCTQLLWEEMRSDMSFYSELSTASPSKKRPTEGIGVRA